MHRNRCIQSAVVEPADDMARHLAQGRFAADVLVADLEQVPARRLREGRDDRSGAQVEIERKSESTGEGHFGRGDEHSTPLRS